MEYTGDDIASLPREPFRAFEIWLSEAMKTEDDATAFALATHTSDRVSVRMVLAKDLSADGITFYTNGDSIKGEQLNATHIAAGVFFWPKLHRQLRFEGAVTLLSIDDAEEYFASRPHDSRVASYISAQSRPVESYQKLHTDFENAKRVLELLPVPRPPKWQGYRIALERIEFWQGQPNRLHQRLFYAREKNGEYSRTWLQP
ncbi:MAG: Pyridoxine/pyridoxamine 5'-phosphate oxidase [Turneriella sp.]|nr:Pyridoxine/pyridoxamine 5'-phosphate oxidase [Turneriella sp.]